MAWLWLYGPPGVGKSATGFRVFERLVERGEQVAFVELDQIGMCLPAPEAVRSAAKADNLLGVLDNFAAVGVEGVVVSGDIGETMGDPLARARERPVLCRLRAGDDVAVERLTARGNVEYAMPSSVYESFDVPAGDLDVATDARSVDEVADEVVRALGVWPPPSTVTEVPALRSPSVIEDASAIMVTGPRAVGTSTVAWRVLMASIASGHRTGYLDLLQLGFLPAAFGEVSGPTTLANVVTCWATFRNHGADRLVLCGHLDDRGLAAVRAAIPSLCVVALTASSETLLERARRRSLKRDLWLPGDDLFGLDEAHLHDVVHQAATCRPDSVDLVLETEGTGPADLAGRIASLWPTTTTV